MFENLRVSQQVSLASWATAIITAQLKYVDTPGHLDGLLELRRRTSPENLPDLHRILGTLKTNREAIQSLIAYFGSVVLFATIYSLALDHDLTMERADEDMTPLISEHRLMVSSPVSEINIYTRQQLAHMTVRGTFKLLLQDAVTLLIYNALDELRWRMFQRFVRGLLHSATLHGDHCVSYVHEAKYRCYVRASRCRTQGRALCHRHHLGIRSS